VYRETRDVAIRSMLIYGINSVQGVQYMTDINSAITAAATDAILSDAVGKKWYASKTFWVNVISAATLLAQIRYGFIIDPATQALILTGVNIVLRKITKESVTF